MVLFALVGRPNVGKSALFNRLIARRVAIVDEKEGVTRDRLYGDGHFYDRPFRLVDTGGIDSRSADPLQEAIATQAQRAIEEADLILFVVDATVGPTAADAQIAKQLHRLKKPILLIINKVDSPESDLLLHSFASLGMSLKIHCSALANLGIEELMAAAFNQLPDALEELPILPRSSPKVAIVGRANVGKSTLINALLGSERVVTSPIAGTTVDAIDIPFYYNDKSYLLIDTAGLRRPKTDRERLDFFSRCRTEKAIERSDIVLLVLDAKEGLTAQERKIAFEIEQAKKGCILLLNKWDLIQGFRMEHCIEALHKSFPSFAHYPLIFISALQKRNLDKIMQAVDTMAHRLQMHISTGKLNRWLQAAEQAQSPPALGGKRLRLYYVTQAESCPPTFVFFLNKSALMSDSYRKYLLNDLRREFNLQGTPIQFVLKEKEARFSQHPSKESSRAGHAYAH